jgi:broad specificity phosphatase PhoE
LKRLFFIRHAESVANERDVLAGQLDFALSDGGRKDAETIAARFASWLGKEAGGETIDRIISSPLLRAAQTAAPFSRIFGLPVETDQALMEQNLGIFSGMTYAEAEAHPGYEKDRTRRWDWLPQGGESYRSIADRLRPFFGRMEAIAEASRILVVTHAVTLRMITALLENSLPRYPTSIARNGELLAVDFSGLGEKHGLTPISLGSSAERKE